MRHRRFAIFTLVIALLVTLVPVQADAVITPTGKYGDWGVGRDDEYPFRQVVTAYYGSATEVTIPTQLGGHQIQGIGPYTFADNKTVKILNVPDNMAVLGLSGNDVIETVNLGKGVTLKYSAFAGCEGLKSVNLPDTLTAIPDSCFANCTALTSLTIPEKVQKIGNAAFEGSGITTLVLPDSVRELGVGAFRSCKFLKSINIPENLQTIFYEAFAGCTSLASIKVSASNKTFSNDSHGNLCYRNPSSKGVVLIRAIAVDYGSEYIIPSEIAELEAGAYSGLEKLCKVIIPDTVKTIAQYAFAWCPNLTEVRFEGRPMVLSQNAFEDDAVTVYYPGDTGEWDYFDPTYFTGNLTWTPYCTGIHTGTIGEVIKDSTCKETGLSKNTCTLCGSIYEYTIPVKNHAYDAKVTKEPMCLTIGEMTYICKYCGVSYTEWIPAPGHKYDYENGEILQEATCTDKGTIHYTCVECGAVRKGEIPRLDHAFENGQCVHCGADKCAALGHNWKDADCTTPKTCTVCKETAGNLGSHIYTDGVDGTCNVCGIHRETTENRAVMHMFRMYDPNSGEHFYTGSEVERQNLIDAGWNYEGVGFTFSMTTGLPVYRLYDPATGEHLYTMSEEEKATLMAQGWNFEGIAFNSAYDTEVPQYRLHNPNETRGAYHFTASTEERDFLISLGWEDQGIGFYSSWK